jgi:hypothetical protein
VKIAGWLDRVRNGHSVPPREPSRASEVLSHWLTNQERVMGNERTKDSGDKVKGGIDDKSGKPAVDQSQQVRGQPDKAGKPPYRGFSAADDPKRVDKTPVDHEGSVDDE